MSKNSLTTKKNINPESLSKKKKLLYLADKNPNLPKSANEFGEITVEERKELRKVFGKNEMVFRLGKTLSVLSIVSVVFPLSLFVSSFFNRYFIPEQCVLLLVFSLLLTPFSAVAYALSSNIKRIGMSEFDLSVNKKISLNENGFVYSYSTLDQKPLKSDFPKGNYIEYTIPYTGIDKIYHDTNSHKYQITFSKGSVRVYPNYTQRGVNCKKTYYNHYLQKDTITIVDTFSDETLFNKLVQKAGGDSIISTIEITEKKLPFNKQTLTIAANTLGAIIFWGVLDALTFLFFYIVYFI